MHIYKIQILYMFALFKKEIRFKFTRIYIYIPCYIILIYLRMKYTAQILFGSI
jgi:hypothetical protein